MELSTKWFAPISWSVGNLSLTYSLPSLGLEGVRFSTSCFLQVEMVDTVDSHSIVKVTKEDGQPNLYLTKENFFFC